MTNCIQPTEVVVLTPEEKLELLGTQQPVTDASAFGTAGVQQVLYPTQEYKTNERYMATGTVPCDKKGLGYIYPQVQTVPSPELPSND